MENPERRRQIDLSIIIPTKNRDSELLRCLESISRQDCLPKELIIVDQGSAVDLIEKVKPLFPSSVRLIHIFDVNIIGLAQARNRGLQKASGELILFFDDDVHLLEGSLNKLEDIFCRDTKKVIGGIGAFMQNDISPFYVYLGAKIFCRGPFSFLNDLWSFNRRARHCDELVWPSKFITGAGSCYRKEVFNDFSYNEYYRYTFREDVIFGNVVSSKYKLFHFSGFRIIHGGVERMVEEEENALKMRIFWLFYFFSLYVDKSFKNSLCLFWAYVGIMFKIILKCLNLKLIREGYRGFLAIAKVVFNVSTLRAQANEILK